MSNDVYTPPVGMDEGNYYRSTIAALDKKAKWWQSRCENHEAVLGPALSREKIRNDGLIGELSSTQAELSKAMQELTVAKRDVARLEAQVANPVGASDGGRLGAKLGELVSSGAITGETAAEISQLAEMDARAKLLSTMEIVEQFKRCEPRLALAYGFMK